MILICLPFYLRLIIRLFYACGALIAYGIYQLIKHKCIRKLLFKTRFPAFFIDGVLLLLLLAFIFSEAYNRISLELRYNVITDVIVSLVPAVITIISIPLQMQTKPIRGVLIKDFNKLRKGVYFDLLHMCIIFIGIFLFETIILLLNFRLCLLLLDFISLLYSTLFLIQEIPLLMRNEKLLDRVLNKHLLSDDKEKNQSIQDTFSKCMYHTVGNTYIKNIYEKWKTNKDEKNKMLLYELINYEYDYLSKLRDNIIINKVKKEVDEFDIPINKFLDICYENISSLLDLDDNFNILLIGENNEGLYYLVRLTLLLYEITIKLELYDKNHINFENIVQQLHIKTYGKDRKYLLCNQYLLLTSIATLRNGETWFVECIRDHNLAPLFFNIREDTLAFLLTFYMSFLSNSSIFNKGLKDKINDFATKSYNYKNKKIQSWKSKIKTSIENLNSGVLFLDSLNEILSFKESIDVFNYNIHPEDEMVYSIDDSSYFSHELIIDYWLQIVLTGYFYEIEEDDVHNFFKKLKPEYRKAFARSFELNWTKDYLEKRPTFLKFINGEVEGFDHINKRLHSYFQKCVENHNYNDFINDASCKVSTEEMRQIKERLDEEAPSIFESTDFLDKSLDLSKSPIRRFWVRLEEPDVIALFEGYLKHLKPSILSSFRKMIEDSVEPIFINDFMFDHETISRIIRFEPDYAGSKLKLQIAGQRSDNVSNNILERIKDVDSGIIPRDMFLKEGAIRINIEYHPEESIVRKPEDDEIERIIDNEYVQVNGYYTFNKYKGSNINNFLVSREELSTILKDKIIFVPIAFKSELIVDKEKILYFKKQ